MNISNLEDSRSRRDYNRYQIEYKICKIELKSIQTLLQLITEIVKKYKKLRRTTNDRFHYMV